MWPARPLIVARPSAVEIMFRHTNGRSSGAAPGRSATTSTGVRPSARSGYRRVKVSMGRRSLRRVPGLDPLGAMEGQLLLLGLALAGERLEDHRVVVAAVDARDDPTDEPVRQALDDRDARRPLVPVAALELVDLVAGLAAEELGDLGAVGGHEVDAE